MKEIDVRFIDGRPRCFYTDLPKGLTYNPGPPAVLFLSADLVRRETELVSWTLADMQLVTISAAELLELVERDLDWFKGGPWPVAFSERCYLAVMKGHINLALRNPKPGELSDQLLARGVRINIPVDHAVTPGKRYQFGENRRRREECRKAAG